MYHVIYHKLDVSIKKKMYNVMQVPQHFRKCIYQYFIFKVFRWPVKEFVQSSSL